MTSNKQLIAHHGPSSLFFHQISIFKACYQLILACKLILLKKYKFDYQIANYLKNIQRIKNAQIKQKKDL